MSASLRRTRAAVGLCAAVVITLSGCSDTTTGTPVEGPTTTGKANGAGGQGGKGGKGGKGGLFGRDGADGADGAPG